VGLSRLWRRGAEKPAVKCIDCGCFYMHPGLAIPAEERPRELTKEEREPVRAGGCPPGWPSCWPYCARGIRFQTLREKLREQRRRVRTADERRLARPGVDSEILRGQYLEQCQCDQFVEHIPGLPPREHIALDLAKRAEREHRQWESSQRIRWALLGALLTNADRIVRGVAAIIQAVARYAGG